MVALRQGVAAGAVEATGAEGGQGHAVTSASAARRAARLAAREEARRATRGRRREVARAAAAERRADAVAARLGDAEDPLERAKRYEVTSSRRAARDRRRRVREALAAPWSDGGAAGVRVAIELGWEGTMHERERTSLATQVTHAYGTALRRCAEEGLAPLRMALTGCAEATDTLAKIDKAGGAENWPVPRLDGSFAEALSVVCSPAEDGSEPVEVVIMSPDAEEPLREVKKGAVYVVGGLCGAVLGLSLRCASLQGCHWCTIALVLLQEPHFHLADGVQCERLQALHADHAQERTGERHDRTAAPAGRGAWQRQRAVRQHTDRGPVCGGAPPRVRERRRLGRGTACCAAAAQAADRRRAGC